MKLIEADKVEQAIKDYWKAQVDRAPIPKCTKEYNAYVNCLDAILEHNDGLLKAIDELPSAEPHTTTHDSIPAKTGKNDGDRTSGDCISRTQAIDTIKKRLFETAFNNVGIKQNIDETLVDVAENRLENWFNELPSIQPVQRWIPVTERLPEPWDFVLVTDRRKDVRVCQMHYNSSDGWYDECDNWMHSSTSVIAWMPFPEPYQEGEQE